MGLDTATFDACVDNRQQKPGVDADIAAADKAGVTGTPAFFINGRALDGAHAIDRHFRDAPLEANIPVAMALVGLLAMLATNLSYWNWYGFTPLYTFGVMLNGLIGFVLAGAVMANLVKQDAD